MSQPHLTRRQMLRLLAAGAWIAGTGCGRRETSAGKLVVYSAGPAPLAEKFCASYTATHGREVELFSATTGQLLAKLEAERFNPRADVIMLASQVAAEGLKAESRLHPTSIRQHLDRPEWHDLDGYYIATGAATVGVALRADHPPPPPAGWDWEDFIGGGYAGNVVMPSPLRSGAAADFLLAYLQSRGSEVAWQNLKRARHGGLQIAAANAQAISSLLTGACAAVIGAADYIVLREVAREEPVRIYYPASGGVVTTRPAAVLATSKRVDEAETFLRHVLSPEAQREVAAVHLTPTRRDVALSPAKQAAQTHDGERAMEFDATAALLAQNAALQRFQDEIERGSAAEA